MSSMAVGIGSDVAAGTSMSTGRLVRAYLTEARYETVRMLRSPVFAIPFLLLPVLLYLLFGVVLFGAALRSDPAGGIFVFTAFAVFGVMGPGMFGFGMLVAIEREQGLLRLKRAQPMPPGAYLLAKMIMAVLFALIVMATMLVAPSLGHLKITAGGFLAAAVINVLGALPFCAVGLFIGVRTTSRSAPAFVNILYQVMMHVSGLFYPLPKVLRAIAPVWPTYHLQQLVLGALGSPSRGSASVHAAVLAGLTLLLTVLSVRRLARRG